MPSEKAKRPSISKKHFTWLKPVIVSREISDLKSLIKNSSAEDLGHYTYISSLSAFASTETGIVIPKSQEMEYREHIYAITYTLLKTRKVSIDAERWTAVLDYISDCPAMFPTGCVLQKLPGLACSCSTA